MIDCGTGIPGSGKSFFAVLKALGYMASGGCVFSNIRLHGVEDTEGAAADAERLQNVLSVIDEKLDGARRALKQAKKAYEEILLPDGSDDDYKPDAVSLGRAESKLSGIQKSFDSLASKRAAAASQLSAHQLNRWRLREDSNVRKVLLSEYKWSYVEGQYHYIDLDTMDDGFLQAIPRGSPSKRILLILDEVNEWFDSLDGGKLKSDEKYREMFKFLRLSRHYHIDVLFLLQDFSTLNARLRGLCASIWKFTDMQKMRVPGVPFRFPFPWFLWQQYEKSGRHLLKSTTWPKEQKVFSCYDSFCEFGAVGLASGAFNSDFSGKGVLQKKGGKKMTFWDRFCVFGVLAACLAVAYFGNGMATGSGRGSVAFVTVTNTVSMVSSGVASDAPAPRPRVTVEYSLLSYGYANEDSWVYANGKLFKKGFRVEAGLVVDLGRDFVRIVGDDGYEHYIYNQELNPDGGGVRAVADRGRGGSFVRNP